MKKTYETHSMFRCHHGFFPLDLPPEASFLHRNFNNMTATDHGPMMRQLQGFDADHTSQDFLIVGDVQSSKYILIGAVTARRSLTHLVLHVRQTRVIGVSYYQPDISPDDEPELMVRLEGEDWRALLLDYAQRAAKHTALPPVSTLKNVTGYCSWYYYYQSVTSEQFFENIAALAAARSQFPVQIAQLDDGYQAHHGDWLTTNAAWTESLQAVRRTTPVAMLLYALVVLWFSREGHRHYQPLDRPWYAGKTQASFADMLATLRGQSIKSEVLSMGLHGTGSRKVIKTLLHAVKQTA